MDRTNTNSEEQFVLRWARKKKIGFLNYFLVGFLGCIAFFFFAEAIACFILTRKSVDMLEMIVFILLSIIFPITAWFYNDAKFKKLKGKYEDLLLAQENEVEAPESKSAVTEANSKSVEENITEHQTVHDELDQVNEMLITNEENKAINDKENDYAEEKDFV